MQGVSKKQKGEFSTLDKVAISLIMQHFHVKDAVALGSTCKKTQAVLGSMWHFFLKRDFGYESKNPLQVYIEEYKWKGDEKNHNWMHFAATFNKLCAINCGIRAGADPSLHNNFLIGVASRNGHTRIVKRLLADDRVDPSDGDNWALRQAAECSHLDIVKLLLADKRVDPTARDHEALTNAMYNGDEKMIKLLKVFIE